MDHENVNSPMKEIQALSFWISFIVACILCILALVQRIRHRQLSRYAPPERRMDPQPFSFSPKEKRGGEQPADVVGHGRPYYREDATSYGVAGLPSACDVLLPLSHSTQLPSSGYLAAVLGRERSIRATKSYQLAQPPCVVAPSKPGRSWRDSQSSTAGTDAGLSGRFSPPEGSGSSVSSIEPADPSSGSQVVDLQEFSSMSASDGTQLVQKRNQVVQDFYDVDDGGVRMYRRTMVEYS
ncbi:hypothetical protein BDV28DRAFT_129819 [Aspergillus coremiiformis]|uniref:Uncharacterized protein n=1 Tax=Aspergillus coremiiformis TaxID=138285 RepID=A0A5N6ZD01_9EURO|nr:hypothetical protein BDV28DRAFT_129819 [Aspergillus coremiiformis]